MAPRESEVSYYTRSGQRNLIALGELALDDISSSSSEMRVAPRKGDAGCAVSEKIRRELAESGAT